MPKPIAMAKVLLVEDAPDLAQLIVRELHVARYEVALADNGVSALQMHADEHPDLVILDWMLPEMDGLEVLRRLRQSVHDAGTHAHRARRRD
jgi:DNA-binding response OmpR family regulator